MSATRPVMMEEFFHSISSSIAPISGFIGQRTFVGGTAVLIAPGLAVTASHVFEEILAQLGCRPSSKDIELDVYLNQMQTGACWYVSGCHSWVGTDITVLTLKPRNDIAETASILRLPISVDPPELGQTVTALGYPGTTLSIPSNDSAGLNMKFDITMTVAEGAVTDLHASFRDTFNLRFPCFAVNAEFTAGMSGGAVFNEKKELCGLVCSGGVGELRDHSYVVSIWPMSIIPIKMSETSTLPQGVTYKVLELARFGIIDLRGHERIEFFTHANGSDGVRRHHAGKTTA